VQEDRDAADQEKRGEEPDQDTEMRP